jgi:hypothetical protein
MVAVRQQMPVFVRDEKSTDRYAKSLSWDGKLRE